MMFKVEGILKIGNELRNFSKNIDAKSEKDALNKIFAEFGSKNGLPRSAIKIKSISKVG